MTNKTIAMHKRVRQVFKAGMWLAAIVLALAVTFYGALLLINRSDRPPSATVLQFQQFKRSLPVVADADNGYVLLMGLPAPKGDDPRTLGKQRIVAIQRYLAANDAAVMPHLPDPTENLQASRSAAVRHLAGACRKPEKACIDALEAKPAAAKEWLANEGWRLDRYSSLLASTAWREILPADDRIAFPSYTQLLDGQMLHLIKAYALASEGDAATVRSLLEADIRFWRLQLEHADTLISKMIAASGLQRHFAFSNRILGKLGPGKALAAIPAQWRAPLSQAERSMLRAFMGEWGYTVSVIRNLKRNAARNEKSELSMAWLGEQSMVRLLQPQDSSNRYAEKLASASAEMLVSYPQVAALAAKARAPKQQQFKFPYSAYNAFGSILIAAGKWDYARYGYRVADLEGIRRASLLSVQLRSSGAPESQLAQRLNTANLRNPYDDKPFTWDVKSHAIVFVGLDARNGGRTAIAY